MEQVRARFWITVAAAVLLGLAVMVSFPQLVFGADEEVVTPDGKGSYSDRQGVRYTLNEDTKTAEVSEKRGANLPDEIYIPTTVKKVNEPSTPYQVTSIGDRAFAHKTSTKITIPPSVTSIGESAFKNCDLNSITIPQSVTSIGETAFSNCVGLKDVSIPQSVTSIGSSAFSGCTGLTSINISGGVKTIKDSTFWGCKELNNITIPDSVDTIELGAFYDCHKLDNVTIPDSVHTIGAGAFYGCIGLKNITIPNSVSTIDSDAFGFAPDATAPARHVLVLCGSASDNIDTISAVFSNPTMYRGVLTANSGTSLTVTQGKTLDLTGAVTLDAKKVGDNGALPSGFPQNNYGFSLSGTHSSNTYIAGNILHVDDDETATTLKVKIPGQTAATFDVTVKESQGITITKAPNMTTTTASGLEKQTGLNGSAMTPVIYTADTGYYFPTNYVSTITNLTDGSLSGIQVKRDSYTKITVSGTPSAKVALTLTAPTAKTHQDAPVGLSGGAGKILKTTTDMEYASTATASSWSNCANTETSAAEGIWYVRYKETDTKKAGATATVTVKGLPGIFLSGAPNMTTTSASGPENQASLNGNPMIPVIYTANTGYYFPDNYINTISDLTDGALNGIKVERNSDTQITIWGTPTEKTTIALTAPTRRQTTPSISLSGIKITTPPTKTIYMEGEVFDKTGMKVEAVYSDGSATDVTDSYSITPTGSLKLTDKEVTVSYVFSQKVPITVLPKAPEAVTIKTPPTKVDYTTGDNFDPTGLVLLLKAGDNTIELPYTEATKKYFTFSPTLTEPLKADQPEIQITYQRKVVPQDITVRQDYADTITVRPTQKTMSPGQKLALTATLTPENIRNKDVKWTCSDSKVAKISATGTVLAIKPGTAVITATAPAKDEATAKTASCTVTVKLSRPVIKATSQNYKAVKIYWKKVKGATRYQLYQQTSSKGKFRKLKTLTGTSYSNTNLATGRIYAYKVEASTRVGSTTHYSSQSKTVKVMPRPNAPEFSLTAGKDQVTVKWNNIKGADGYTIYRASSEKGTYKKVGIIKDKSEKYIDTNVKSKNTYYYRMKSYTTVKGQNIYSKSSGTAGRQVK